MDCSTPDFPVLHYLRELLKLMSIVWMMSSSHLILCHPLSPPALNSSQHQGRFNESALHIGGSKYWSFSFGISLFDEYSGFRINWFDILVVQETLKDLQQHS